MPDAGGQLRVLFASMPFDGHFLPLSGFAHHVAGRGHDVRFYTGPSYARRLSALEIPHLPFRRATEVNGDNLADHFPEVESLKGPKRIAFDLEKIFFGNTRAHFDDIREVREQFPFDVLVADGAFYAAYLVSRTLAVPVYGVGPGPTPAPTSKTAPPPFFGLTPATNPLARVKHRVIRAMVESTTKNGMRAFNELLASEGVPAYTRSVFDLPWDAATLFFQTGVPGMDFPRDDWPANHRFVGPLLPARAAPPGDLPFAGQLDRFASVVVVSQGTVDNRDPEKLLVPALTALAGTEHLVVACTGRRHTDALRERFPHDNVVVEDWVDFEVLLPRAGVFICNGGYGSIMQALMSGVPIVSAGKLEGKNDINARLAYRGFGHDLKTERPKPEQIAAGVAHVLGDPSFKLNVARVADELSACRPFETMEAAILTGAAADPRHARHDHVLIPHGEAARQVRRRARRASRVAGVLAWATGLGFGPLGVYGTIHFARHGDVWQVMGFPTYSDGPFERIGIPTSVPLLAGFVAVCVAELMVGSMLWAGKPGARQLSVGLLPIELAHWVGFALPRRPRTGSLANGFRCRLHAGRFRAVNSSAVVLGRRVRFRRRRRQPRPGP